MPKKHKNEKKTKQKTKHIDFKQEINGKLSLTEDMLLNEYHICCDIVRNINKM